MNKFQATVELDGRFWFVQVEGVGATQARHLRELDTMVADLIQIKLGDVGDDIEVDYTFVLPAPVEAHAERARELRAEATRLQLQATEELGAAVAGLRAQSLPYRDIGRVLGISHQRVQQLLAVGSGRTAVTGGTAHRSPPALPA